MHAFKKSGPKKGTGTFHCLVPVGGEVCEKLTFDTPTGSVGVGRVVVKVGGEIVRDAGRLVHSDGAGSKQSLVPGFGIAVDVIFLVLGGTWIAVEAGDDNGVSAIASGYKTLDHLPLARRRAQVGFLSSVMLTGTAGRAERIATRLPNLVVLSLVILVGSPKVSV